MCLQTEPQPAAQQTAVEETAAQQDTAKEATPPPVADAAEACISCGCKPCIAKRILLTFYAMLLQRSMVPHLQAKLENTAVDMHTVLRLFFALRVIPMVHFFRTSRHFSPYCSTSPPPTRTADFAQFPPSLQFEVSSTVFQYIWSVTARASKQTHELPPEQHCRQSQLRPESLRKWRMTPTGAHCM
eukprot:1697341-Amphidinium_carterae.1